MELYTLQWIQRMSGSFKRYRTYSHSLHFKITELARRFNPETVLRQHILLLYNPCEEQTSVQSLSPVQLFVAAAAAKSLQSCLTLCNPMDGSPSGSPIPGILQARTLEWVAISFSNAWKWKVKVKSLSRVWLLATPWTAAYQAPLSMGFSRQEYWSGVPLPSRTIGYTYM